MLVWLVSVLVCFSLGLSYMGLFLDLIDLIDCFLCHVREVFNYNLVKKILIFFWDPYNFYIGVLNIVPEVSETILNICHSFLFILLFSSYFHYSIFQLSYLFFCLSYSATDSCRRYKRYRFSFWVGKIPWRRTWLLTPVLLLGESHG